MLVLLKSMWKFSSRKDKMLFYQLLFFMFVAANMELLGIGMLLPVVAVLTNPELLHQNRFLSFIYQLLHPASAKSFLLTVCFLIVLIFLAKNLFLVFMTWFQTKVIYRKSGQMAYDLFRTYVFAPYSCYLNWNTSDLLARLSVVRDVYNSVLISLLFLLTEILNVIMIFAMFFFFVPGMTLILLGVSAVVSFLIYYPLRNVNARFGREYFTLISALNRNDLQALNGIKEIRIRGIEKLFLDRGHDTLFRMNNLRIKMNLCAQLPRFLLEVSMVAGGMILIAIYIFTDTASTSIILKLSLIAAGIVRLMPALSRIQYHYSNMRQQCFSMDSIYHDLTSIQPEPLTENTQPMTLAEELKIDHLSFRYEQAERPVFKDFSLQVPVNTSVAFIGKTGCGKTTLVDLIAGLLAPDSGRILADGRDIRENLRSWRSMIGYVPQSIYLLDDTILANVTFGIDPQSVDMSRVEEVLAMAQLDDFIASLPDGVNTVVGERGARLSGGQRQRIGIARALYSNPRVLILDEATSALDNDTEKAFIDAIKVLHGRLTLFIIAHRLSTTQGCSMIVDIAEINSDNPKKQKKLNNFLNNIK